MSQFIEGESLRGAFLGIIREANTELIIVSPYIKLDEVLKDIFESHKKKPDLKILIVFGKNKDDISKSLNAHDTKFFKGLPNIVIKYRENLHAKYYANENKALLTSLNLYDHSFKNNVETGILLKPKNFLEVQINLGDSVDEDAWFFFHGVINNSITLFEKEPEFERKNILSKRNYVGSKVIKDQLKEFIPGISIQEKTEQISDPGEKYGYCIRTGVKIQFNPKQPFCAEAFKEWNKYKRDSYPEKYCHFSGEVSNGKTSYSKPILWKNYKQAMQMFDIKGSETSF